MVGWGEVVKKVHGTREQPMNLGPKDRAEHTTWNMIVHDVLTS